MKLLLTSFWLPVLGALAQLTTLSAHADTWLIEDAELHTLGAQGVVSGDLLLVDGRIEAVAPEVTPPPGTQRFDAEGRSVTPGLFNAFSDMGLIEISAVAGTRDDIVEIPDVGPSIRPQPAVNPYGEVWRQALVSGVTFALTAPGFGQTSIAGRSLALRLGQHAEPVLENDVSLVVAMNEVGAALVGGSRAANFAFIRQAFLNAEAYAQTALWHQGLRLGPHELRALHTVREANRPLAILANRVSDIRAAIALAREFDMSLVILGGIEAWQIADELARANVPVILYPFNNTPDNFESLGARLDSAVVLHAAGVEFAMMTSDAHESSELRQIAGNLVAEGLPWQAALASITLNPSRIWGVSDRTGSLEVGKLADVVVWSGDPLEVTSSAEQVFVAGAPIDMRSRQDALFERYQSLPGGALPTGIPSP